MSGCVVTGANVFVSRWFVKPECREEFSTRFNALWQPMRAQLEQAVHFVFYGWGRDSNEFVAIESWKDEQAVAALRQSDFFKQSVAPLMDLCSRDMEMTLYAGIDAPRGWLFATYPAGPSTVHPHGTRHGAVFQ